jgi:hypothetical protein
MKLILTRIIYSFDFDLADPKCDWFNQASYVLWDKNPLMLYIKERKV